MAQSNKFDKATWPLASCRRFVALLFESKPHRRVDQTSNLLGWLGISGFDPKM
jgi:hypothetical protein